MLTKMPCQALPIMTLGIPVYPVTMTEALSRIDRLIEARRPRYLVTANVHFAAAAQRDPELHRILCQAELVLCDGTPLVWASRWLGGSTPERVAGSDLLPPLLERAARRGYRTFFLGSTLATLREAKSRSEALHPGLEICGLHSPPEGELLAAHDRPIVEAVRAARPDLLLVALGCPKQEKLISRLHRVLGVPCSIGVGASLDFLAGKFSRAPEWMKLMGTEWLYRLLHEPARLFPRYAEDFRFYFPCLAAQLLRNGRPSQQRVIDAPGALPALSGVCWYRWRGRVDADALRAGRAPVPLPRAPGGSVAVALGEVCALDASALGALVHAWKLCRDGGAHLVLYRPSQPVLQALQAFHLERVLPVAYDADEAQRLLSGGPATDLVGAGGEGLAWSSSALGERLSHWRAPGSVEVLHV